MMKYVLGKISLSRLSTCHPIWWTILNRAIKISPIDFGVVCGFRNEEDQTLAYLEKKSNARWGESDHNWMKGNIPCSLAIDLAPYSSEHRNYMWSQIVGREESNKAFEIMSKHIIKVALEMRYKIKTGANYSTIQGGDKPHHVICLDIL